MSVTSLFASYFANAVWQVALVAATGWLASCLLSRLGPRTEHIGWVSTLVIAVFSPVAPLLCMLPSLLFGQPSSGGGKLSLVMAAAPEVLQRHSGLYLYQWPSVVAWTVAVLYFGAIFYFAFRMVWSLFRVRAIIAGGHPQHLTAEQEEIWRRCRRQFAIREARLLSSDEISGPVIAGVRRPVLVVPAEFTAHCAGRDLLAALAHECAHAERRDIQKNLCYEALSLAMAFHPAIWFIKARIAQTREMICDRMVAERVLEPRGYAHSLLRLAAMVATMPRTDTAHAIGIFDANILEKRIMMMSRNRRNIGPVMRSGLTFLAVLLLASSGVVAAAKAIVIESKSAPAADQSGKPSESAAPYGPVYRIGKGVSAPIPTVLPDAEFPRSARGLKKPFSAIVLVKIMVDKDGMPRDVQVFRSYKPDFDREAVKAVEKYRFKPAMKDGSPVAVAVTVEVKFQLY